MHLSDHSKHFDMRNELRNCSLANRDVQIFFFSFLKINRIFFYGNVKTEFQLEP